MVKGTMYLNVIDMEEYIEMADIISGEILDREARRAKQNFIEMVKKGIKVNPDATKEETKANMLTVTMFVTSNIERMVLNKIQKAEEHLAKEFLGDENDFGRQ